MVSSLISASTSKDFCPNPLSSSSTLINFRIQSQSEATCQIKLKPIIGFSTESEKHGSNSKKNANLISCYQPPGILQKALFPLVASAAIFLGPSPANAGILSGFPGIESVPGPQLPQIDSLSRWNEANQKKYAEFDARFKESPLLKKLLEQSKLNKDKNQQTILDKYCIRGAEWGVGDCSAAAMSPDERENFIAMLKKKAGVE